MYLEFSFVKCPVYDGTLGAPPSLLLARVLGCASERRAAVVFLRLVALVRACFVLHGTAAATDGWLLWCGCRTFIPSARFFTARALFPCVPPPSLCCDRAVLIDSGRVVAAGTMAELRTVGAASESLLVECAADASTALREVRGVRAVRCAQLADGWFACEIDAADGVDATVLAEESGRVLVSAGNAVRRLERSAIPLEAIVRRILAGAGAGSSHAAGEPARTPIAPPSRPGAPS